MVWFVVLFTRRFLARLARNPSYTNQIIQPSRHNMSRFRVIGAQPKPTPRPAGIPPVLYRACWVLCGIQFARAISYPTGGCPLRRIHSPVGLPDTSDVVDPYLVGYLISGRPTNGKDIRRADYPTHSVPPVEGLMLTRVALRRRGSPLLFSRWWIRDYLAWFAFFNSPLTSKTRQEDYSY